MMPMTGRTRVVLAAWAVVASAIATLAMVGVASPAGADPAVAATPDTDLVDGQEITVELSGWGANGFVGVLQCTAGLGIEGCDSSRLQFPQIDANGNATLTMRVYTLLDSSTGTRDCRVVQCVIAAGTEPSGIGAVTAALAFDPGAPLLPPPTLTVDPDTDLVDGQTVTAAVAGARAGASYVVVQCAAAATEMAGCRDWNEWVELDDDGNGSAEIDVYAAFRTRDGTEVDCRTAPATCDLRLYRQGSETPSVAATGFDPDAPLLVDPTLSLAPPGDFVDRQTVSVSGAGWTPGSYVQLQQCAVETAEIGCRGDAYAEVTADGTFTQDVTLDAVLFIGPTSVDCRTAPGRCEIRARTDDGTGRRDPWLPLAFDPDAPLVPPPVATVTPDTDLVDGQVVEVSATGLIDDVLVLDGAAPSGTGSKLTGSASIALCDTSVPGNEGCGSNTYYGLSHEDGAFTTVYVVASVFTRQDGTIVDCRVSPCDLRVGQLGNPLRSTSVPLSFDPDGPLRPPPSMTVTPNTGLVDRDVVTVELEHWPANYTTSGWLCRPGWVDNRDCMPLSGFDGTIGLAEGEVTVRSVIRTSSTTFDCRTVPSCDLVAGYPYSGEIPPDVPPVDRPPTAVAPISFDPDGPLRSPEITGLEPDHPVVDGQIVTLHARYLTPYTSYRIRQCREAGELTGFACDDSTEIQWWADATGEIAPWVIAHRMLTLGDGTTTDCTVDACVLLLDVRADAASDRTPLPMTDGTTPPPVDPTDPPAQTPTTTAPPTTTTTRSTTTAATPASTTPHFTG